MLRLDEADLSVTLGIEAFGSPTTEIPNPHPKPQRITAAEGPGQPCRRSAGHRCPENETKDGKSGTIERIDPPLTHTRKTSRPR